MASAFIARVKRKYWVDESGKRIPKGTPGAAEKTWESTKYYIFYRDASGKQKSVVAHKDKRSSEKKMSELLTSLERGEEGLADPFKVHRERKVVEHLEEYLPIFRQRMTNNVYRVETERILRNFLKAIKIENR